MNDFRILNNYYNKTKFLNEINKSIFQSIEEISGSKISHSIKKFGLNKIHNHFPVEYIPFLQYAIEAKIKKTILKNIYLVSKNNLKIKKNFFVDDVINVRIHYPFNVEKKSKLSRKIYRCLDLKKFKNAKKELEVAKKKSLNYKNDTSDTSKLYYFKSSNNSIYHHSPHKDTWFGHCATQGVNFWWALSSVNELNGLMLFTDIYNYNIEHEKEPAYVKKDYALGKIKIPKLKKGNLLLFDPEILHATRVNTSKNTRLVISGRMNKGIPQFTKDYKGTFVPKWILSSDLAKNIFNNTKIFNKEKNPIKLKKKKKIKKNNFRKIIFNSNLKSKTDYKIIKHSSLKNRSSFLIQFNNYEICLKKINKKIFAFSNLCPHLQFKLINSFNENNFVTCNGHGLKFNINNGLSTCKKFKLKIFKTFVKNNFIYIRS